MFYYLNGTVTELLPQLAVVDCGGVGYACKTTTQTLSKLKKGNPGKLYTYLNVSDNIFELYGFATQQELDSFQMLIGVSGVGPKAALAILSDRTPDALALAILSEDEKALMSAPGVGKKTAQRIILDLKDKIAREYSVLDFSGDDLGNADEISPIGSHNKANEAAQALAVLGYSSQEAARALKGLDIEKLSLEEIIRQSLKKMIR